MAKQGRGANSGSKPSGPGNKIVATTLLESLAVRGQMAAHDRAFRALEDLSLADSGSWISDETVLRIWAAADVDPSMARSVGHRLLSPDATGIALYGLGLATPEKAYRRVQALLPRINPSAQWCVDEIGSGSARMSFRDPDVGEASTDSGRRSGQAGRGAASRCALRAGMLEAIPSLYGLLPARVKETSCQFHGAEACQYEIEWSRGTHVGLVVGAVTGFGFGVVGLASLWFLAPFELSISLVVTLAAFGLVLGVCLGACRDLVVQLKAVADARRGHLALFDQVDDALASKLDALARVDSKLEEMGGAGMNERPDRVRLPRDEEAVSSSQAADLFAVAQKIRLKAGDLECWLESDFSRDAAAGIEDGVSSIVGKGLSEIREWADKISEAMAPADGERPKQLVDMAALLSRAISETRSSLAKATVIHVDLEKDLDPVECEPVQIEQVVAQLIRNAATASGELSEEPQVSVSLGRAPGGIEFSIEDRGVGIEGEEVDEVFDPFFGERRAGIDEGFGLPVCLRILEGHGGELRIESEGRIGTRVSVFLPETEKCST